MTALLAPRSAPTPPSPSLQPVTRPGRQVGMAGFIAVVAGILVVGMVGVLVLTTMLQGQAFEVERKRTEATALSYRLSDLQAELAAASSVQHLGVAAQQLGMKPNPYPVQLRLPDGKVIGEPTKVTGVEIPSVRYVTPAQAAAELQARHEAEARKKAEEEAKRLAEEAARQAAADAKTQAAQAPPPGLAADAVPDLAADPPDPEGVA